MRARALLSALLCALVLPWAVGWPSDANWSSGPLHAAHTSLEQDCKACHAKPFERVRNETCLDCHASNLHQHVAAGHAQAASLAQAKCTNCHVEHDEPSTLVNRDQRVCLDCHADPKKSLPDSKGLQAVADFGDSHPEFRVSMIDAAASANDSVSVQRLALDSPGLRERSGLKFTHAKHLDPKGVKTADGQKVMACADCHVANRDGRGFAPITMETSCASCHKLEFDPATPDRKCRTASPRRSSSTLWPAASLGRARLRFSGAPRASATDLRACLRRSSTRR